MNAAKVIARATDQHGMTIGEYDPNPVINTRVYDVMLPRVGALNNMWPT